MGGGDVISNQVGIGRGGLLVTNQEIIQDLTQAIETSSRVRLVTLYSIIEKLEDKRPEVGKLIKYHRSKLGLSMANLSNAMTSRGTPLSKTSISDIENGKQKPTKATLTALCAVFGVKYKDFLELLIHGVDERYYKAVIESVI